MQMNIIKCNELYNKTEKLLSLTFLQLLYASYISKCILLFKIGATRRRYRKNKFLFLIADVTVAFQFKIRCSVFMSSPGTRGLESSNQLALGCDWVEHSCSLGGN